MEMTVICDKVMCRIHTAEVRDCLWKGKDSETVLCSPRTKETEMILQ